MRGMNMGDEELEAFLDDQRTLYLATVSENGWPHVAPVGFARLDDGHFYVLTHPSQRKSKNVFHDNRVGLTLDDGETYTSLRGVFVHGYATVVTDAKKRSKLEGAWVERFYDGEIPDVVKKVYAKRDGWIWFDIEPVHTVTWDNRKLDASRLAEEDAPEGMPFRYGLPEDMGAAAPDGN
jgi:nitroimidazol reductase NimA-like FMN-containing flavoprotein (pyridoxamine 5'-phosphate oxidase superfamily)